MCLNSYALSVCDECDSLLTVFIVLFILFLLPSVHFLLFLLLVTYSPGRWLSMEYVGLLHTVGILKLYTQSWKIFDKLQK